MPTALSHPAVALAMRFGAGHKAVPGRLLALAAGCSILPDIDALGFWLGVPYEHALGHRGLTHSFFFALAIAWIASRFARGLGASRLAVFVVVAIATGSHGVLDALTSGGLGIAFFSPLSNQRFFCPWRPIVVSPISVLGFFEARSLSVVASELLWVWTPAAILGVALRLFARPQGRRPA